MLAYAGQRDRRALGSGRYGRAAAAVRAAPARARPAARVATWSGADVRRAPDRQSAAGCRLAKPVAALARLLAAERPRAGEPRPVRGVDASADRAGRDRLRWWR